MAYFLEIEVPGRVAQRFQLPEGAVHVGSGKEAEIQLEDSALAACHLSLEACTDGALLRALVVTGPSLVTDGLEQSEALVPWSAEAFIGGIRLSFVAEDAVKRGTNPWLLLLVGAVVAFLGWRSAEASAAAPEVTGTPPPLKVGVPTCSEPSPEVARAAAKLAVYVARSKQERYPFDAADGVKALESYRLAEVCFGTAGDAVAATGTKAAREAFEAQVTSDYAGLRFRLQRALAERDWRDARWAAEKLETLIRPLGVSSYRTWLHSVQRGADARLSRH
jgi:hypothetical protein